MGTSATQSAPMMSAFPSETRPPPCIVCICHAPYRVLDAWRDLVACMASARRMA